jgi:hypothetical protein
MNEKFYVKKIIRDDSAVFEFDANEIYLSTNNTMLIRPEIYSTDVNYTDTDGGEMILQKLPPQEQPFEGIIYPKTSDYWDLYFKLGAFFKINHYYTIIYKKKSGQLFAQRNAWLIKNLQVTPGATEEASVFSVSYKMKNSLLFEYAENNDGEEVYANSANLPLLSSSEGGEAWDSTGQTWDAVGSVWSAGQGGVQSISIDSVTTVYPIWTVSGSSVNPVLQNNTTDSVATYNGTVAAGQTLVVDFASGIAKLDGALVTRNISGQVSFKPGTNIVGFNSDGGTATSSTIKWNNVIG